MAPNPYTLSDTTLSRINWVLLGIPAGGGTATRVLPQLQQGDESVTTSIDDAAMSPTSDVMATFNLLPPLNRACPNTFHSRVCEPVSVNTNLDHPRLRGGTIRVRRRPEATPPELDPRIEVPFLGRSMEPGPNPLGLASTIVVENHPFHREFNEFFRHPVRISWAPDGDRFVYSDGLRLLTWDGSAAEPRIVPGTEDGMRPAWSPDGEWIAFERLERGPAVEATCEYREPDSMGVPVCYERHTTWPIASRTVSVIRPDGTDLRTIVPDGRDPAWAPESDRIFFVRGGFVWLHDLAEGTDRMVPGTRLAREPAVSPDGSLLAFTRLDTTVVSSDIWVVSLEDAATSSVGASAP